MTVGIFYIPTLDTSGVILEAATAEGAVVTAPLGSISTMACDVSYNAAMASFSFKSVSGDPFENFTSLEGVVEANFLGLPKTKDVSSSWALAADTAEQKEEILQVLARAVTGSSYGSDLFNNQKDVADRIKDALTACNDAVRASEDVSASLILTNAILASKPERFLLSNDVTTDLKNNACMNTSVYNNLFCESITVDGTNAFVSINVELSGNEILRMNPQTGTKSTTDFSAGDSIQITDSSGQPGMGTGIVLADISGIRNATTILNLNKASMFELTSDQNAEWVVHNHVPGLFTYQELTCKTGTSKVNVSFSGDIDSAPTGEATCINLAIVEPDTSTLARLDSSMNIVIKNLNGTLGDVSNNEINSVGAGLINGTFDDASGMATPLIPGDKIQILFTIKPHTTQKTLTGHPLRENEGVSTMLAEYTVGAK